MKSMLPVAQPVPDRAGGPRASRSSPHCGPVTGKWSGGSRDAFMKTCWGALEEDAKCSKCTSLNTLDCMNVLFVRSCNKSLWKQSFRDWLEKFSFLSPSFEVKLKIHHQKYDIYLFKALIMNYFHSSYYKKVFDWKKKIHTYSLVWMHHLVVTGGTAAGCDVGFSICSAFLHCGCDLE